MSEYELLDYTGTLMGNFQSALTLYFTIVTAYVIAAFIAGTRLTRLQLYVVNICFVIAASVVGYLTVAIFDRFFAFASQNNVPDGTSAPVDFTWPLGILVTIIFVGCIIFMWSVRNNEK